MGIHPPWFKLQQHVAIGPDTNDMKVDIQRVCTISCNDGKAIPVPATLLQEHGGRQWLKLRPTSQPMNQMVHGKVDKNASFSNHPKFQDFIAKRNQVWAKEETEDQVWDAANEDEPKPSAKKRKREDPEVVSVPLAGVAISCLMQGQRPTKSDVVVPLEASQLEPIFELLQEDADQLKARKPYQRKVQKEQKQPEEAAPNM